MNGIHGRIRAVSLCVLIVVLTGPLGAIDFDGAEVDYSLRIIGSQQDDLDSGSTAAVWSNVLAARFPILLENENFAIVPGISFTSMYYRYDARNQRAVPTDVEWRELTALVPVLDFTFRWQFLSRSWGRIAAETGLGFHLPVPLKTWTTGAGSEEDAGKITPALYSGVQFVLPACALQANWPVSDKFEIITRVSGYIPVYHFWDGKGLPLSDGLVTGLHVGAFFPF